MATKITPELKFQAYQQAEGRLVNQYYEDKAEDKKYPTQSKIASEAKKIVAFLIAADEDKE